MFYCFSVALFMFIYKVLYFYKITGRENLPDGAFLMCANHTGLSDPIFLALALGLRTKPHPRFMAKAELFDNKLVGAVLRALGAFPVRRGEADIMAIKESLKTLSSGGRLVLFPEGTRNSSDGAKAGAGMFALRSGCDVVPVYITPGRKPFHRVRVVVGKPFRSEKPAGKPSNEDYHQTADEILKKVYELKDVRS